jgi:hypothetical protein
MIRTCAAATMLLRWKDLTGNKLKGMGDAVEPDHRSTPQDEMAPTQNCHYSLGSYPTACASRANSHGPWPSTTQKIRSGRYSVLWTTAICLYACLTDQHQQRKDYMWRDISAPQRKLQVTSLSESRKMQQKSSVKNSKSNWFQQRLKYKGAATKETKLLLPVPLSSHYYKINSSATVFLGYLRGT